MATIMKLIAMACLMISLSSKFEVEANEWPMAMSMYSDMDTGSTEVAVEFDGEGNEFGRRSLVWHHSKYYISYGALAANRIPCPPRSGRSYYTNNCFKAQGPAHPYTRGCSRITRCRR